MAPDEPPSEPLQFQVAELAPAEVRRCAACQGALRDEYFEINGKLLCPTCQPRIAAASRAGAAARGCFCAPRCSASAPPSPAASPGTASAL
jgi:hypothetical protein